MQEDVVLGRDRGVNSTPSFMVDGELIANPGTIFPWTQLFADRIEAQGLVPENSIIEEAPAEDTELEE